MDAPVRLERLREVSLEDEEFMHELIEIFLADAPEQLLALERALADGDGDAFWRTAHRLKGSSGSMGADRLADICRQLEQLGQDSRLIEAPEAMRMLGGEYGRVREYLENLRTTA